MLSFANWISFPVHFTGILNSQVPFCLQSTEFVLITQYCANHIILNCMSKPNPGQQQPTHPHFRLPVWLI